MHIDESEQRCAQVCSSQCESVRAWSDLRRWCSGGEGAVGERVPPSRTLNFSQLLSILDQKQYCVNKHCELTGKRLKYCRVFSPRDWLVTLKRLHSAFPKDSNIMIRGMQGGGGVIDLC